MKGKGSFINCVSLICCSVLGFYRGLTSLKNLFLKKAKNMIQQSEQLVQVEGQAIFVHHYTWDTPKTDTTLVLLHDSLGSVELWRDWPELLATQLQCNVMVYDRVGYGKSQPLQTSFREANYLEQEGEFLERLRQVLELGRLAVFGHSDGASIALWYGILYPANTVALVIEAGHIFVEEMTLKGVADAKKAYEETDLRHRLTKYHGERVEKLCYAWFDIWLDPAYRGWTMVPELHRITSPLLFLQGDLDEYGTLDQVEQTVTNVSGIAEKYIFEQVGHIPHKEQKEKTLYLISSFLNHYL